MMRSPPEEANRIIEAPALETMWGGRDAGTTRWQAVTVKTYGALVLLQRYQGSARVSETIAPGESML